MVSTDSDWTYDALDSGDLAAIKQRVLDEPRYLSARGPFGETPLQTAVSYDSVELVRFLLEQGADPNTPADDGYTCLLTAIEAETADSFEITRLLINSGGSLNQTGTNGFTPLHMAASRGRLEKARLLIDAGADVNARKEIDASETPLMEAAFVGHPDMVRLLLANGADAELRDTIHGRTALETARYTALGPDPMVLEFLQELVRQPFHEDLTESLRQGIIESLNLNPEDQEKLKAFLPPIDQVELYRQRSEQLARDGDHAGVIKVLIEHLDTGAAY